MAGTVAGTLSPATSGTTITRATFETGSGTNVMAIDLKFTSSYIGADVVRTALLAIELRRIVAQGLEEGLVEHHVTADLADAEAAQPADQQPQLLDHELGVPAAAHIQIPAQRLAEDGSLRHHLRAERERRP